MCTLKVVLLIMSTVSVEGGIMKTPNNYGPYLMEWGGYHQCNGPKSVDDTHVTSELILVNDNYILNMNMTFLNVTIIDEIRITVYNIKSRPKTLLWNYKIKKPCQHFAFANIIRQETKSKNCVIPKATYFSTLSMTGVANSFLGSSFFYGEYLFKALTLSKKGNILCMVCEAAFNKLKKT